MKETVFNKNNFDIIRLFAALQVVLFHGISHLKLDAGFLNLLGIFPGVPIFFVISGFLISASYQRSQSLLSYYKNRVLRIYPGLWVCLIISIFTAICWGGIDFMSQSALLWGIAQSSFGQFYNPDFLRGYGVGVLNGSLWTIPVELQFYVLLPCIYLLLGRLKKNVVLKIIFIILAAGTYVFHNIALNLYKDNLYYKLFSVTVIPYLFDFMLGVILQVNFFRIKGLIANKFLIWLLGYIVWVVFANYWGLRIVGNHINPVSVLILAFLVLSFAYTRPDFGTILRGKDFSYGVYIYHMVVFNVLVQCNWVGSYLYLYVGIGSTFILAILSWYFVEKPALKLKNHFILKKFTQFNKELSEELA